jgi:hypothetical protein
MANKHKKSVAETAKFFGKNICVYVQNKTGELELIIGFFTTYEIKSYFSSPIILCCSIKGNTKIKHSLMKFFLFKALYKECWFKNCSGKVIALHNMKSLHSKIQNIFSIRFIKKYKLKIFNFKAMNLTFG